MTLRESFAGSPRSAIQDPEIYPRDDIELALRLGRGPSVAVKHEAVSQWVDAIALGNPTITALRHTDHSGKGQSCGRALSKFRSTAVYARRA